MKHITGNWTYTIGGIPSCPICGKRDKIIGIDGAYECGRCDISPTKYVANMQARIEELEAKNKELTQALADLDEWICIAEELDFLLDEYGRSTEPMTPKAEEVRDWMQVHVIKPQERIAELEKLAVVWHKYPDEKPPESGIEYLVLIDGEIPRLAVYGHHVLYEDDTMNKWYSDEGPAKEPVPYGETEITHWAYLPDMPEEEK